jgi:excisionase family DNA binding protein
MITTKQAAKKLGVSEIRLRHLLQDGRIPGATKFGVVWQIPDKPVIEPPLEVKYRRKK